MPTTPKRTPKTTTARTTRPAARATGVRAARSPGRQQTLTAEGSKQIGFIYPISNVRVLEQAARENGMSVGALVREFVDAGLGL